MKNFIFVILSLVILSASAGIVAFVYKSNKEDTSKNRPTSNTTEYPPNASRNTDTNPSAKLQVQGATTNSPTTNQNQLPTPESFDIYNKYANEPSALYADILVGSGEATVSGDTVAMVYKGWLTTGELFDQNRKNDEGFIEPFVFKLGSGQVIPGWEQTIAGMKKGGKRRLIIPSTVGYGPNGQGPIPPNSTLIFDVELIDIQR